jgi:anti-anti-sigma regulatory factor
VNSTSIVAGHCGDVIWITVNGAGSKENSADVLRFIEPEIALGTNRFVVDLDSCSGLDSTFMGMLIGISKRLARVAQGCLHVINAHGRNAQLLRGLGVQYFCSVTEDGGPFEGKTDRCGCAGEKTITVTREDVKDQKELEHHALSKVEQTEHCLKAHQELCQVGQANEEKFHDVVELMGQKLLQMQR